MTGLSNACDTPKIERNEKHNETNEKTKELAQLEGKTKITPSGDVQKKQSFRVQPSGLAGQNPYRYVTFAGMSEEGETRNGLTNKRGRDVCWRARERQRGRFMLES